ncbi:acyl carrier protein [Streptomyces phaeolivaceus]|uniref:acyl carrier protein n=1 Tax=Streptomyces phaeolivaceus TaxID=2653200 RepID=UPI00186A7D11|nr:acyl carrier protein [Streptomyces phaeolivaceus]
MTQISEQNLASGDTVDPVLQAIWAEALGLVDIGPNDDFLRLGGHSLLAMRIAAEVSETFGIELPMTAVFRYPTLAEFEVAVQSVVSEYSHSPRFDRGQE